MKYGYVRVSCADKQEYLRQKNILKDYNIDKLFEETFGNQKKYIDMLHKETGELLVKLLAEKDKQITELQKQLEEKEKEIEKLREWLSQCETDRKSEQEKKNLAFKKWKEIQEKGV